MVTSIASAKAKSEAWEVSVYDLQNQQHDKVPVTNSKIGEYYFSDKLDVSDYYKLDKSSIETLDDIYNDASVSEIEKPKLYINLHGVSQGIFKFKPIFKILESKYKKIINLDDSLTKQLQQFVESHSDYKINQLTSELKLLTKHDSSLVNHFKYFDDQLIQIWNTFKKGYQFNGNQQVLSNHVDFINEKSFINGLSQLIHLNNIEHFENDDIIKFDTFALDLIGKKIGYDSTTYKFCEKILGDYLILLSSKFDITVLTFPSIDLINDDEIINSKKNNLRKRDLELSKVFETYNKRSSSQSSCFTNEEACQVGTSNCNSHGVCTKIGSKCWQCLCSSSFNETTHKTTNWSGFDCGSKDISAQANLLFWSSLAIIVAFIGGIKLLVDVGGESLPGVLDAATAPTKKN